MAVICTCGRKWSRLEKKIEKKEKKEKEIRNKKKKGTLVGGVTLE